MPSNQHPKSALVTPLYILLYETDLDSTKVSCRSVPGLFYCALSPWAHHIFANDVSFLFYNAEQDSIVFL